MTQASAPPAHAGRYPPVLPFRASVGNSSAPRWLWVRDVQHPKSTHERLLELRGPFVELARLQGVMSSTFVHDSILPEICLVYRTSDRFDGVQRMRCRLICG